MVVKISTQCFNGGWNPRVSRQFIATFSACHVGKPPKGREKKDQNESDPQNGRNIQVQEYFYKLPRSIIHN